MQRNIVKTLINILVLVYLTGCVAQVDHKSFSPTQNQKIASIGIPTIYAPESTFLNVHNPALAFGLIGGLAFVAETDKTKSEMIKNKPEFDTAKSLQKYLFESFIEEGYYPEEIKIKRQNIKKFIDTSKLKTDHDAILDVVIIDNLYTNRANGETDIEAFRPALRVAVKLISNRDNSILYSNTFMYGSHNKYVSAVNIDAPREFYFETKDDLIKNKEKVFTGLEVAAEQIAKMISSDLAKGSSK